MTRDSGVSDGSAHDSGESPAACSSCAAGADALPAVTTVSQCSDERWYSGPDSAPDSSEVSPAPAPEAAEGADSTTLTRANRDSPRVRS